MTTNLPTWGETAKGVKIIDGEGEPAGTTDNPLLVRPYSPLAVNGVNLLLGDTPAADAFSRLRVSQPTGVFSSQLQYDASPILWESSIANNSGSAAVTHLPAESAVRMTAGANDVVVRQTRSYYRYQPGKSQLIMFTLGGMALAAGVTRRIGYFDGGNGIFYQVAGSTISFVARSNVTGPPVDTSIPQSAWNIDRMDGTGPSGLSLDPTKAQIIIIDLEWLGVGRDRCGFVIDGKIFYAHEFLNANAMTTVYMATANLPMRYELSAGIGVAGTHTLTQICSQIASEGGFEEELGFPFSKGNGVTTISVTTRRPIFSIRPRALFGGMTNRALIVPEYVTVFTEDVTVYFEVVYGGTLTGASFGDVDPTNSIAESDVAATAITGGITVISDFAPALTVGTARLASSIGRSIVSSLPLTLNIAGNHPTSPLSDVLSVVVTSKGAAATDVAAAVSWRELR